MVGGKHRDPKRDYHGNQKPFTQTIKKSLSFLWMRIAMQQ